MSKSVVGASIACLLCVAIAASPAHASRWNDDPLAADRYGAFVGARIRLPTSGQAARPQAMLTIAPIQSQSGRGTMRTRMGEGVALNFSARAAPSLSIAGTPRGVPANEGPPRPAARSGLSSTGWVAIGVGVVAAAAAGFALWVDSIEDNSD